MADREQLTILREGAEAWNRWREEHIGQRLDLTGADLSGQILRSARLGEADLTGANLREADLTEARLTGTNLNRANLTRTNFTGARVGWTVFGEVDLSTVRGLETVIHVAPSIVSINTLYRSRGEVPEVFLRGTGAPEVFITYVKSLVARPFEYHSCFISYSSADDELAQRLYIDLQAAGVQCWFAPEDLKIGDEFRSRIDESIYLYNKLLLILSTHSLGSRWVQKEVETAFEKEGREHRLVLFLIRIDEAIMESRAGWAADIRRMRHIGNFQNWKHHDIYQIAFARLLRDLKTASVDAEGNVPQHE